MHASNPPDAPAALPQRRRRTDVQREILAAIHFYEARGWDWISVVAFLAWKGMRDV